MKSAHTAEVLLQLFLTRTRNASVVVIAVLLAVSLGGCNSSTGVTHAPPATGPSTTGPSTAGSSILLSASSTSVRAGGNSVLTATVNGTTDTSGTWAVLGGTSNGQIDTTGHYQAPTVLPDSAQVIIAYSRSGVSSEITLSLLNPLPAVTAATPTTIGTVSTPLTITGSGFVPGSMIAVNGTLLQTHFIDSQHVSGVLTLTNTASVQLVVTVHNPDPGASTSAPIKLATNFSSFTISPQILAGSGGPVTLTWKGSGVPSDAIIVLDGRPLLNTSISTSSISASGVLPPWRTGSSDVQLVSSKSSVVLAEQQIAIAPTPATFDQAARFSTQAAFGPRPEIVTHIQQVGLDAFITEQFSQPAIVYDPAQNSATQFSRHATSGQSLLRLRLAWALQNFIVAKRIDREFSFIPFEQMLERDCSGNFRQLLSDIASDPSVAFLLNLAGNAATSDPTQTPNQNFARELMQLYTLGPNLLNDDGSLQLDGSGLPIPTYTQAQVIDLSRVFTGWNYPRAVNPALTSYYGIDLSQPLIGTEAQHDERVKLVVGQTLIPAGQGIAKDRDLALDAIFMHPNLPPYISHLLIQHLVKSAPSPGYIQRVAKVFKDDGTGTRGNLTAVVRAVLLDPEARAGDTAASGDDGFLQEPLLFQLFATSTLQLNLCDDQSDYWGITLGQMYWGGANSVFGYYRPDHIIPGTSIVSPEFQVLTNENIIIRSQYLWGLTSDIAAPGFNPNPQSWLHAHFTTVPDLIEALDHLAFHGTMPAYEKAAIQAYCDRIGPNNKAAQFHGAVFLALNSDHYTVSH